MVKIFCHSRINAEMKKRHRPIELTSLKNAEISLKWTPSTAHLSLAGGVFDPRKKRALHTATHPMNMSQQVPLSMGTVRNVVEWSRPSAVTTLSKLHTPDRIQTAAKRNSRTNVLLLIQLKFEDNKMGTIFLISFCLGLVTGHFRGPHHPRSSVSHHHYTPQNEVKLTQDAELLHDATHLKEDLGSMADQLDFSKMTEQEIEFHYFQIHDVDNNTKLDGLEILHALQHTLHENDEEDAIQADQDWIVGLIDKVLEEDDLNNDGYLEYVEYVLGRQRDHVAQEKRNKLRIGT